MAGKYLPALLLACCAATAQAKEKLTWLLMDWPPFFLMQGDQMVGGVTGDQMKMLFARLPEYEHVTQRVSVIRLETELMSNRPVCSMPLQRTAKREPFMLFSVPMDIGLSTRLIVRQDSVSQFGEVPALDLATVASMPNLHGLVHRSRSYGPLLDQLFATPSAVPNLQFLALDSDNILRMLDSGRIDYTIEYPLVVRYWESQQPSTRTPFASYKLVGNAEFSIGVIACAKTEFGAQAIARINAALKELFREPDYQHSLYQKLSEAELKDFQHYWQKYILEQSPLLPSTP
ncbi:TIGR02285 family protein [Permianibacter sp. IMCC34836]|uniref:TIGR02285 family protein n=1 Tax=Permianibacter fluminis TaxID=2738515 RepID=UPI0015565A5C|nr:TIGR02285 family protein [Permianibacter fluminis]NQD37145.1 TIGR02285 family protein [Permianibacter fluminis]